jgi:hypothetical protein
MLIEKERHYSVIQSFTADNTCNENEFTVLDYNQNPVGYFVQNVDNNTFEVYHSANSDYDDYSEIDYTDNYNDALNMIIEEIEYDLN